MPKNPGEMSKTPNQPEARLKDTSARPLITVTDEIVTENNLARIKRRVKRPAYEDGPCRLFN